MEITENIQEARRVAKVALDSLDIVQAHEDADLWVGRARNCMEQALRFLELARTAELEAGTGVGPRVPQ